MLERMREIPNAQTYSDTYHRHVDNLQKQLPREQAMEAAVGGNFERFGQAMRDILAANGLRPNHYLVDVGCGSGRLAHTLDVAQYLGTDVVPDLLAYARTICPNPAWRFEQVTDLVIPENDGVADMVCFFSVFTHLLHEDSYRYLMEARRVLKPGGRIVISFLEFLNGATWDVFRAAIDNRMTEHTQFLSRDALEAWALHLPLRLVSFHDGSKPYTPDSPVLGQSICVLERQ